MLMKYVRSRYAVLAFLFLISVILTCVATVSVGRVQITDPHGGTSTMAMPVFMENTPPQVFKISFELNRISPLQDVLHIIPDNRVNAVRVNGTNVNLLQGVRGSLEDWDKGFEINLGRYFRFGNNSVEIDLENMGGPMGLVVQSKAGEFLYLADLLLFICLLVFVLLGKNAGFSRGNREQAAAILTTTLLAFVVRVFLLPVLSGDYGSYLSWFLDIKQNGFASFRHNASNYAPAYLYLLGLTTFLPAASATAIKTLPILADFVSAVFAYKIVREFYPKNGLPAVFAYFAMLFWPTVWLNSAYWGQCDSLFMTFIVMSLYQLVKGRSFSSLLLYSVAFSLKVQAVFVAPLFLVALLLRLVPFRHFFLIPGVFFLTLVPSWIAGRPITELLLIYVRQGAEYSNQLTLAAPSFYQWFANTRYLLPAGIIITLSVVLAASFFLWNGMRGRYVRKERLVEIALLFSLAVPFFLPCMHDRYFYPADVLALLYAFIRPKRFYVALIVVLCSLFSYGPFLFGLEKIPLAVVSLAEAAMIALVMSDLFLEIHTTKPARPVRR